MGRKEMGSKEMMGRTSGRKKRREGRLGRKAMEKGDGGKKRDVGEGILGRKEMGMRGWW
jgi:hypothetical protein